MIKFLLIVLLLPGICWAETEGFNIIVDCTVSPCQVARVAYEKQSRPVYLNLKNFPILQRKYSTLAGEINSAGKYGKRMCLQFQFDPDLRSNFFENSELRERLLQRNQKDLTCRAVFLGKSQDAAVIADCVRSAHVFPLSLMGDEFTHVFDSMLEPRLKRELDSYIAKVTAAGEEPNLEDTLAYILERDRVLPPDLEYAAQQQAIKDQEALRLEKMKADNIANARAMVVRFVLPVVVISVLLWILPLILQRALGINVGYRLPRLFLIFTALYIVAGFFTFRSSEMEHGFFQLLAIKPQEAIWGLLFWPSYFIVMAMMGGPSYLIVGVVRLFLLLVTAYLIEWVVFSRRE